MAFIWLVERGYRLGHRFSRKHDEAHLKVPDRSLNFENLDLGNRQACHCSCSLRMLLSPLNYWLARLYSNSCWPVDELCAFKQISMLNEFSETKPAEISDSIVGESHTTCANSIIKWNQLSVTVCRNLPKRYFSGPAPRVIQAISARNRPAWARNKKKVEQQAAALMAQQMLQLAWHQQYAQRINNNKGHKHTRQQLTLPAQGNDTSE